MEKEQNKSTENKSDVEPGTGGSAVAKVKDTASTIVDEAKSVAGEAYASVTDKAASAVEDGKATVAGEIDKAAQAARRIGNTLGEGELPAGLSSSAAKYAETGAKKLEQFASYFENTDLRGIGRDVEGYARRNPALFIGAAFGLGILAARFIKSAPPVAEVSKTQSRGV